jgi:hypothetical protein
MLGRVAVPLKGGGVTQEVGVDENWSGVGERQRGQKSSFE